MRTMMIMMVWVDMGLLGTNFILQEITTDIQVGSMVSSLPMTFGKPNAITWEDALRSRC